MRWTAILFLPLFLGAALLSCQKGGPFEYTVPVEYFTLDNGLKVVLSPDNTAPTVCVAVYYNIGFRIEPRDRTGFAHLFEHMMFQGSRNLGKMEFIRLVQDNGGVLNGSTRFDFTNYFEIVPAHKLETMLWAEADRMRGLDISEENLSNQKGVVKNEVKVNVLNQPYGGFPWLDMPQHANTNWYNAHNFYGDLADLDAATVEDVRNFFTTYYSPANAALVVVGDFEPASARELVQKYFGPLPSAERVQQPDISEPDQHAAKWSTRIDSLANKPAVAFAYHVPERGTREYYAMGLLDQMLLQGDDAMLRDVLVKKYGWTSGLSGGINADLGDMFDYSGPMLWTGYLFHDNSVAAGQIIGAVDSVLAAVASTPIDDATLARAKVKFRSSFYDMSTSFFGFGRANLLASFALFDNEPEKINSIDREIEKVNATLLRQTAEKYLRKTNQTVLVILPGSGS